MEVNPGPSLSPSLTPAPAPAPWTCKCTAYWLLSTSPSTLPTDAYAPLEAASAAHSDPAQAGAFKGGLAMVQIVRYSDTPVGPYDELVFIPGNFDNPQEKGKKNLRVTRIYVSQKETCYNGRLNWNIPKHLARFSFTVPPSAPNSLKCDVFPPSLSASTPFFTATLTPFRWLPSIPYSSTYIPHDPALVQPPLPAASLKRNTEEGDVGAEVLCGTEKWAKIAVGFSAKRARGCWVDVHGGKEREGWWPGFGAWRVGMWMEDGVLEFPVPEAW